MSTVPSEPFGLRLFERQMRKLKGYKNNSQVPQSSLHWLIDTYESLGIAAPVQDNQVADGMSDQHLDMALARGVITPDKKPVSESQLFLIVVSRSIIRMYAGLSPQEFAANPQQPEGLKDAQSKALVHVGNLYEKHVGAMYPQ